MHLRVLCEDPTVGAELAQQFSAFVVDEPAPIGLVLKAPSEPGSLWLVLDRSGFVYGRCRRADDAGRILRSLLTSFEPSSPEVYRLRCRAFVASDGRMTVSLFPLFVTTPPIERRLERLGLAVYDRLAVDLGRDLVVVEPGAGSATVDRDIAGHISSAAGAVVRAVVVPAPVGATISRAQATALVASSMSGPDRSSILDVADALVETQVRVVGYPVDELPYDLLMS
jgi:hypothetical protein